MPRGGYKTTRDRQVAVTLPRVSILDDHPNYMSEADYKRRAQSPSDEGE